MSAEEIRRFYRFLSHAPHGITEVRVIDPKRPQGRGVHGIGYFDDENSFVESVSEWDADGKFNLYAGLNPRSVELLDRASNCIRTGLRRAASAGDITRAMFLGIDIDPRRPRGEASTDAELALALGARDEIAAWLRSEGIEPSLLGMSGNGGHIIIALPPTDQDLLGDLLGRFTREIQRRFAQREIAIDSTFDWPRIWKIYGTTSRKGRNTADRPWRLARIDSLREGVQVDVLERMAAIASVASPRRAHAPRPGQGDNSQAALEQALSHCHFLAHARAEAAVLPEPLWYAMVSNLARFDGGREAIHELSSPYPGYSVQETDAKIEQALRASGPHTCRWIDEHGYHCPVLDSCPARAPAGLGAILAQRTALGEIEAGSGELTATALVDTAPVDQPLWGLIEDLHWIELEDGKRRRVAAVNPIWRLTDAVIAWLNGHGARFYRGSNGSCYIYFDTTFCAIEEHSDSFSALLARIGKVNRATSEGRQIMQAIRDHAVVHGEKVRTASWIYTDKEQNAIYVHLHNDQDEILKISSGQIERLKNGLNPDHIVLATSTKVEPIEFDDRATPTDAIRLLQKLLIDRLTCTPHDRALVAMYTLACFVKDYARQRAILKAEGSSESGKTTAADLCSILIYGQPWAKVATVAANYSDGAKNPLLILDNLETDSLGEGLLEFLLTSATGIAREKRARGTDTEVVSESPDCLVMVTAIEPFRQTELINRTYEIQFDSRYKQLDWVQDEAYTELRRHRGAILSGFFRLLADHVLPSIAAGRRNEVVRSLNERSHAKARTNEFLALLGIILASAQEVYPSIAEGSAGQEMTHWIEAQEQAALQGELMTNPIVLLLDALLDEMAVVRVTYPDSMGESAFWPGDEKYPVKALRHGTETYGYLATMNQLFAALSTVAKTRGLQFPFRSVRQFVARLRGSQVLRAAGWAVEQARLIDGVQRWRFERRRFERQGTTTVEEVAAVMDLR